MTQNASRDLKDLWGRPLKAEEIQLGFGNRRIATIGDMVTYTYLMNNKKAPEIMVFDLITERKPYEVLDEVMKKRCKFREIAINPPGQITHSLEITISRAFRDISDHRRRHVAIQVIGEEDLAALPALIFSDDRWSIIYGVPGVGMQIIDSNKEIRKKAVETLYKMYEK